MTTAHLNLRWTVKDVETIQAWLEIGLPVAYIAQQFAVPTSEIVALAERNGFRCEPDKGPHCKGKGLLDEC